MVYDFLVILKKPDYSRVDQVSRIMYIFALLVFSYYYYHYPKSGAAYLYLAAAILLVWIYTVIKTRQGPASYRLGLFIAAAGWFLGPQKNVWIAILYAVAGLLEKQVKFQQEIGFSEEEISFNSFPKKNIQWDAVNNALIKDGLVTIDLKNNKLFQKEIEGYVTVEIEEEFNNFCAHRISTANNKSLG